VLSLVVEAEAEREVPAALEPRLVARGAYLRLLITLSPGRAAQVVLRPLSISTRSMAALVVLVVLRPQ
jgi:hypothetical protein